MSPRSTHIPVAILLAASLILGACDRGPRLEPERAATPESAARMERAAAAAETGDAEGALALLEQVAMAQPGLTVARLQAAEAARRAGAWARATVHAEAAMSLAPEDPEARVVLARCLARTDTRRAGRTLAPLLDGGHAAAEIRLAAGEIALAGNDPGEAMGHFRAAAAGSGDARVLLDAARGMARAGFHDDAVAVVQELVEQGDHGTEARYTLAWTLEQAGRYQDCVREYATLIREHPDCIAAYRNLGTLMARDGELPRAIRLWEAGLEHAPDDAGLRANVAAARRALGLEAEVEG